MAADFNRFKERGITIDMEGVFKQRIGFSGDLKDISMQVCKDYGLGEFRSNRLILMGYEDFNFIIETSSNSYMVKVFANFRNMEDCKRYVDVMEKAAGAGVAIPKLLSSKHGSLYIKDVAGTKLRLCVMEFIDGKTIFEVGKKLSVEDVRSLAHQAALINSIKIKPKPVYDHWAIANFPAEYEKKAKYLSKDDLELVIPLVKKFGDIDIKNLPHCFVHGDIIATNVMRDKNNRLWIIDFAVSNYYPRIQELAVLACNLLFDETSREKSLKNRKIALDEYQKTVPLTKKELEALPAYIELAHGMHVLSANFEKVVNNVKLKENEYWLNQGRMGLRQN